MAERQTTGDQRRPGVDPSSFGTARPAAASSDTAGLHVCADCSSELVYPVDWAPADHKRWRVDLRCPDCEWHGGGVYAQNLVDAFDEELDRGTEQLLGDLTELSRANMEEEIERFVSALNAGWILAEDF